MQVDGAGPIDSWEKSELGAIVTVVLVQAQAAAAGAGGVVLVIASGTTGWISKGAPSWAASAAVIGTPPLQPGAAVAYAHGLIEYAPGVLETYDWTVHVVLQ
jgi:hypothetical protein